MTVLTRFEPFREFATLQDRINRVFRDSYGRSEGDESLTTSSFAPAVRRLRRRAHRHFEDRGSGH